MQTVSQSMLTEDVHLSLYCTVPHSFSLLRVPSKYCGPADCVCCVLAAVMASVPGHPFWLEVMHLMSTPSAHSHANQWHVKDSLLRALGFKASSTILESTGQAPFTCAKCL